ncbi:hypothetical protein BDB00DRAFT_868712 [Zychaea mexicana]|uniref:uncharacterized protein n=1 Tax=Zychaea mexicana TaxID=64656 RepID=UPI0022FE814F|nr:uncharacterized protein BDB00DRAFT_868712 [Zychaea mexicana]KAI9497262.1 hypothetical protein BDB00DRAFT_868712 [Zychaea mexicana]
MSSDTKRDVNGDAWSRLDNLVQLSYSATDVSLVLSQYKNHCWQLHVLSEKRMYHIKLNNEKELEDVMVRLDFKVFYVSSHREYINVYNQQRQPIASSPDQFVEWFSTNMVQGHLSFVESGKLKIGDKDEWLELRLEQVDDTRCRQEISWQLLLKFAQHIQKEGCVIDTRPLRSSSSSSSAPLINKLQEENTTLKSELEKASMQQKHAAPDYGGASSSSRPRSRPAVQPRTEGMSLINPSVKKRKRTHAEFAEPSAQVGWDNDAFDSSSSSDVDG